MRKKIYSKYLSNNSEIKFKQLLTTNKNKLKMACLAASHL